MSSPIFVTKFLMQTFAQHFSQLLTLSTFPKKQKFLKVSCFSSFIKIILTAPRFFLQFFLTLSHSLSSSFRKIYSVEKHESETDGGPDGLLIAKNFFPSIYSFLHPLPVAPYHVLFRMKRS